MIQQKDYCYETKAKLIELAIQLKVTKRMPPELIYI
jgi:hypothetical protein